MPTTHPGVACLCGCLPLARLTDLIYVSRAGRELALGPPDRTVVRAGNQIRCGKIAMAVQPANALTIEQFVRPC